MSDTNEESLEAPKKTKTPAQLENVTKARAKKAELDAARQAERDRLAAERRFDKLLELFDQVRVEPTPRVAKPKPAPIPEDEDDTVQRPKAVIKAEPPARTINLRFC